MVEGGITFHSTARVKPKAPHRPARAIVRAQHHQGGRIWICLALIGPSPRRKSGLDTRWINLRLVMQKPDLK